jgi:hypothetical protein
MISEELRRYVGKEFPDAAGDDDGSDAEMLGMIFEALEAGKNLAFLGRARGCAAPEILALKKIEEAYLTSVVPASV